MHHPYLLGAPLGLPHSRPCPENRGAGKDRHGSYLMVETHVVSLGSPLLVREDGAPLPRGLPR